MDWLLNGALNFTVLSLTAAIAGGALVAGYCGVLELLQGGLVAGPVHIAVSVGMAIAAWGLVRNRNDLVDRRI